MLNARLSIVQFASEELQEAWRKVGNPNSAYYPDAVRLLIDNRDQLPAPFVVQMGFIGQVGDPYWRPLVESSVPLCRCGTRRYVLPMRACAPFVLADRPVRLEAGKHLSIALWGGDTLSTMIRLSLHGQDLFVERLPFVDEPQRSFFGFLQPLEDKLQPLEDLQGLVAEEPPFMGVALTDPNLGMVPTYTITGVEDNAVTVQLHAGVARPEQRSLHRCT